MEERHGTLGVLNCHPGCVTECSKEMSDIDNPPVKCPSCKSEDVTWLSFRSILIAVDDSVDIDEYVCNHCGRGFDV